MLRKTAVLAVTGLCGFVLAAPLAKANVLYTFTTTQAAYLGLNPRGSPLPLNMSFDLMDPVVQSGHFSLSGSELLPSGFTGDNDFVDSITIQGRTLTRDQRTPYFGVTVALGFDATGDVTSSRVQFLTDSDDGLVSGNGPIASGYIGSDDPRCNADAKDRLCFVSGTWSHSTFTPAVAAVPEPASFALLGAGVLALAARRLSRGWNPLPPWRRISRQKGNLASTGALAETHGWPDLERGEQ